MITPVLMPQLGLEVTEGTVLAVLVEIGSEVQREQALMELETDKAVTELLAPCDGVVRSLEAGPGDSVPVGGVLLRLAARADEALGGADGDAPPAAGPVRIEAAPAAAAAALSGAAVADPPRPRVAPVARRAARDLGVDLTAIAGTGPRGRITLKDVQAAAPAPVAPVSVSAPAEQPAAGVVPLTPTRRAIARRMTASQLIPQYHLVRDVDATHLLAEKAAQASRGGDPVGINDLLVQAIAETAVRHPALATSYVEGDASTPPSLRVAAAIDVGLAVATDRGLVVAVIRAAQRLGLAAIAAERRRLVAAARAGRLGLDEMSGGTITLSSLAAAGVDRFTAMVNPGESAIVAVGRMLDRLVPRDRTIAIVPSLTLTLTFDHRVVDGAAGGAALAELAGLLEGGMTWRP